MKTQRDWCGLIGWLLAASLIALQAQFAHAADAPTGPSISLNRGESYVIKDVSTDSTPEVKSIDNPRALIVNKQPNGTVLVVAAEAGRETVKVKNAGGKFDTYTVTVHSNADPNNPLAPGSAPAAISDSGSSASTTKTATTPLDAGTGPAGASAAAGSSDTSKTRIVDASGEPVAGTEPAAGTSAPEPASANPVPAGSPETSAAPSSANETAPAAPAPAPDSSTSTWKPGESGNPAAATNPATESPMGLASSGAPVMPSQTAFQTPSGKFRSDPPAAATDQEPQEVATSGTRYLPNDAIAMMFGTSRVFDFPQRIKRVSIADSEIADLQVINPHQLMLIGHKPGFTTLAIWDNQGHYVERQVRIEQTGHEQVLLNCTVAEVNRQKVENQGINYAGTLANTGLSIVGLPGQVATPYTASSSLTTSGAGGSSSGGILPPGGNLIPLLLSSNLTYGLSTQNDGGKLMTNTFFQFIENHNLGRILAEPRLLANSGQEAKFLSGGEIPIVLAQALNTSVVFKQFGTSVAFIPTVVGKHQIELVVKPEVSKPDFSQGVQLFGFTVPAFVTRRAETVVRMKDDQTLIIAGLISSDKQEVVQKVPYLGDIPWVRGLFRTTSYQNVKTELVMSVTPQIVGALPPGAEIDYRQRGGLGAGEISTTRLTEPDASRPRF